MPEGVLDAGELLVAVGSPQGTRARACSLQAPYFIGEDTAFGEASRDSSALGLQGRRPPAFNARGARGERSGEVLVSALSALESSVFWLESSLRGSTGQLAGTPAPSSG